LSFGVNQEHFAMIEFLTGILVIVTAIYAYLTYRMARASEASVEAMQRQSEDSLRPYITVSPYIRPNTPVLYLRIANTGLTGANNLKLDIDRDFYQFGNDSNPESNLRTKQAFIEPMDSMAPGAELVFGLAQGWVLFGNESKPETTPSQFVVTATYDVFARRVTEQHKVDLRPYIGSESSRDPVAEELEGIRKALEKKH